MEKFLNHKKSPQPLEVYQIYQKFLYFWLLFSLCKQVLNIQGTFSTVEKTFPCLRNFSML